MNDSFVLGALRLRVQVSRDLHPRGLSISERLTLSYLLSCPPPQKMFMSGLAKTFEVSFFLKERRVFHRRFTPFIFRSDETTGTLDAHGLCRSMSFSFRLPSEPTCSFFRQCVRHCSGGIMRSLITR